jgi:four helix bundle protein
LTKDERQKTNENIYLSFLRDMLKHNFRQLRIWIDSVELTGEIYKLTQSFPNEHKFGIANQLYRSAVSIPSNIAEGSSRKSEKEFAHFLSISMGSAFELETQLIIAESAALLVILTIMLY